MAACEQEATPFPVDIPAVVTNTPDVQLPTEQIAGLEQPQSAVQPTTAIRYGLASFAIPVRDMEQLQASADLILMTEKPSVDDLGTRFDIIASYGEIPGAEVSPITPHLALVINTQMPPMNDPAVVSVISRAFDTTALVNNGSIPGLRPEPHETAPKVTLRTDLANAGWPDGFDVRLADSEFPVALDEQLGVLGMGITRVPLADTNRHMMLVMWTTPEDRNEWVQQAGDESLVIDLFAIPISYWAVEGLNITFTPGGWPIQSP